MASPFNPISLTQTLLLDLVDWHIWYLTDSFESTCFDLLSLFLTSLPSLSLLTPPHPRQI